MVRMVLTSVGQPLLGALFACIAGPSLVAAHDLTRAECAEGGEFIRNAALARDAGITRQVFVDRLTEDLVLIQSFPPHLRWFVQDAGDERLLSEAVFRVFDAPVSAADHETEFIDACVQSSAITRKAI